MFTIPPASQAGFVITLIILAALAMASNRVRYDMVALLVVITLMLFEILPVSRALAGFGNSVVILIAGLLVIGEMLDRTGVARFVGDWIQSKGGNSYARLITLLMLASAFLSAIMSSTAVVAIFIPIVLRLANRTGITASQLLLPMSYAALVSGMLTLIATPPNLVISSQLQASGFEPLGFFSFFLPGLLVLALTIGFVLLVARTWLPRDPAVSSTSHYQRSIQALWDDYRVDREIRHYKLPADASLSGTTVGDSGFYQDYGVRILGISRGTVRNRETIAAPASDFMLKGTDALNLIGPPEQLDNLARQFRLQPYTPPPLELQLQSWEMGAASVLIHPNSRLIGKTVRETRFRSQYGLDVLGIRRNQQALTEPETTRLAASDSLLVTGSWSKINALQARNHDFVVLETPQEAKEIAPSYQKLPIALGIAAFLIAVSVGGWIPLVATVLICAVAAVTSRCLSANDAYRAIHWQSLVLLAGMLPLADALQQTGGTGLIVNNLIQMVGGANPGTMLTLLFFITALLTMVLSNTASAVLMAPIAITTAAELGVSPYPLALAVLFAASSAFMTPIASPVVTLVVEPGRYRFGDFVKMGTPMLLLVYAVTYVLIPRLFPWYP